MYNIFIWWKNEEDQLIFVLFVCCWDYVLFHLSNRKTKRIKLIRINKIFITTRVLEQLQLIYLSFALFIISSLIAVLVLLIFVLFLFIYSFLSVHAMKALIYHKIFIQNIKTRKLCMCLSMSWAWHRLKRAWSDYMEKNLNEYLVSIWLTYPLSRLTSLFHSLSCTVYSTTVNHFN